jgi:hypothetical protein
LPYTTPFPPFRSSPNSQSPPHPRGRKRRRFPREDGGRLRSAAEGPRGDKGGWRPRPHRGVPPWEVLVKLAQVPYSLSIPHGSARSPPVNWSRQRRAVRWEAMRAGCPSWRSSADRCVRGGRPWQAGSFGGVAPRINASEADDRREWVGDGASAIQSFVLTASPICLYGEFPPALIPYLVFVFRHCCFGVITAPRCSCTSYLLIYRLIRGYVSPLPSFASVF